MNVFGWAFILLLSCEVTLDVQSFAVSDHNFSNVDSVCAGWLWAFIVKCNVCECLDWVVRTCKGATVVTSIDPTLLIFSDQVIPLWARLRLLKCLAVITLNFQKFIQWWAYFLVSLLIVFISDMVDCTFWMPNQLKLNKEKSVFLWVCQWYS